MPTTRSNVINNEIYKNATLDNELRIFFSTNDTSDGLYSSDTLQVLLWSMFMLHLSCCATFGHNYSCLLIPEKIKYVVLC